mgnify:CR=1 FL=1
MERTIKNFNKFTKDLWEEFAMNFLNSIVPNPFEVLGNLDDISLEYEDLEYSFTSYLELININDNWSADLLYSELSSEKFSEDKIPKILKYSPGTITNFELVNYIEKGEFQLFYKFGFSSKKIGQKFGEMLDEFYYPMMMRIENEYSLTKIMSGVTWGISRGFIPYGPDFPNKGKFPEVFRENEFGRLVITTKVK